MPNQEYDTKCYDKIFEEEFPDTFFISGGNASEVRSDRFVLMASIEKIARVVDVMRLIDRDDQSDSEIDERKSEGVRVLSRRNLESYLLDDEVLIALAQKAGHGDKINKVIATKNRLIQFKKPGASDDLKPIAGELYNQCKNIFGLIRCGNNAKAFMQNTLAPLIKPEMQIYKELKRDIFGTGA